MITGQKLKKYCKYFEAEMCNRGINDTITITNTIIFVKKITITITNTIIIYK